MKCTPPLVDHSSSLEILQEIGRAHRKSTTDEASTELVALRNGLSDDNKRIAQSNHHGMSSLLTYHGYTRNIQDSTEYNVELLSTSMVLWIYDTTVTSYGFEVLVT